MHLRLLGFCGVDDSVDPRRLVAISQKNPFVEWGVLFHPGREGTPRYASRPWVDRLLAARRAAPAAAAVRLAAHVCGPALNQVLGGDVTFVKQLAAQGFGRVQLNATAVNGALVDDPAAVATVVREALPRVPAVEWILQRNEETLPLWSSLIEQPPRGARIATLFDASAGLGISPEGGFPQVDPSVPCGYAGGIGCGNLQQVLEDLAEGSAKGHTVWVDMETSLRRVEGGEDVFALDRAESCIETACGMGYRGEAPPGDGDEASKL